MAKAKHHQPATKQRPTLPQKNNNAFNQRLERVKDIHIAGRIEEARTLYKAMLAEQPDHGDLNHSYAILEAQMGNMVEARDAFEKAYKLNPQSDKLKLDYAQILVRTGIFSQTWEILSKVQGKWRDSKEWYVNASMTLRKLKNHKEALAICMEGLRRYPDYADLVLEQSMGLFARQENEAALLLLDRYLEENPNYYNGYNARGVIHDNMGHFQEALADYKRVVDSEPQNFQAHFNYSNALLLLGHYEEGWKEYEFRSQSNAQMNDFGLLDLYHQLPFPQWDGVASLEGKSILVIPEQGMGDNLQFLRYIRLLITQRGAAEICFVARDGYAALFDLLTSYGEKVTLLHYNKPFKARDYHITLMSLPRMLATTTENIPPPVVYRPDAERQQRMDKLLGPKPAKRRRIGFVMSGSGHIANRDTAISDWQDLWRRDDWQMISLQKALSPQQREAWQNGQNFTFIGDDLRDFADTATLINACDYVITIDTAVAHLAGSQNFRKEFQQLLLPTIPSWRWLLGRNDSPWYPNTRLHRQTQAGEWRLPLHQAVALIDRLPPLTQGP